MCSVVCSTHCRRAFSAFVVVVVENKELNTLYLKTVSSAA